MPDTDIMISELPAASAATAADQLETNQSGTTRRVTLDQVTTLVAGSAQIGDAIDAAIAEIPPPEAGGTTILDGSGAPADALGEVGDYYLDTDNDTLYGPKTEGIAYGDSQSAYPPALTPNSGFSHPTIEVHSFVRVTADGQITAVKFWYDNATTQTSFKVNAWSTVGGTAGTRLGTATVAASGATGWRTATLETPVDVVALDVVCVSVGFTNAYSRKDGEAFPITNGGDISATLGGYAIGLDAYPGAGASTAINFYVDGVFREAISLAWPVAIESGGGAPSGPAGGDLAGSYPNPTLAVDRVNLGGDTMTGDLNIAKATPTFNLNKTAAAQYNVVGGQLNGLQRWYLALGDTTAESGSNAGSDFSILRFDDAGGYVGEPLKITRSTGAVTLAGTLSGTLAMMSTAISAASNDTTVATTAWVKANGAVMQTVSYQTGAVATGTTVIPFDDTIPQITEGNEYMTLAITPRSATSRLIISVVIVLSSSATGTPTVVGALFQDSTANALASAWTGTPAPNSNATLNFSHVMTSGTTSTTTFRVRAGGGAAGTTTFNGISGTRYFGGVMASSIVIQEVL